MSITIENITQYHLTEGLNRYRLRIDDNLIVEFEHVRSFNGLSQCLRDAADAVDAQGRREHKRLSKEELMEVIEKLEEMRERSD